MQNSFLSVLKTTPLFQSTFTKEDYFPLDLSSSNVTLDLELLTRPHDHHNDLQLFLKANKAQVAYGGYLEKRPLYDRSAYFQAKDPNDKRNIHLGMDFWCPAGTAVHAPLDGEVHSFKVNKNFGDYGPTLILKHTTESAIFHTLYGHLSIESLKDKTVGQKIMAGEIIASLGTPEVNGEYAPHLHFQIVKNMEDNAGDYPGVCSINSLDFYKKNCPDPNLLLSIY